MPGTFLPTPTPKSIATLRTFLFSHHLKSPIFVNDWPSSFGGFSEAFCRSLPFISLMPCCQGKTRKQYPCHQRELSCQLFEDQPQIRKSARPKEKHAKLLDAVIIFGSQRIRSSTSRRFSVYLFLSPTTVVVGSPTCGSRFCWRIELAFTWLFRPCFLLQAYSG